MFLSMLPSTVGNAVSALRSGPTAVGPRPSPVRHPSNPDAVGPTGLPRRLPQGTSSPPESAPPANPDTARSEQPAAAIARASAVCTPVPDLALGPARPAAKCRLPAAAHPVAVRPAAGHPDTRSGSAATWRTPARPRAA